MSLLLLLVLYFLPPVMESDRGIGGDGAVIGCGRRMVVMLLVKVDVGGFMLLVSL